MHRYSIRHPWFVLVLAAVAVVAAAPGVLRLELRTDGHALVPQDRDEVIFDRRIREEFNTEDVIVVLGGGLEIRIDKARLVVTAGPDLGRELTVGDRPVTIGRADEVDLALEDPAVSRHHLRVEPTGPGHRW